MSAQDGSDRTTTTVRDEAERLVAAGLAAVSMAADRIGAPTRERGGAAAAGFDAIGDALFGPSSHRRHSVATDSEECCRCPVCRVISAARQPDPDLAERIATGVGDLAEGAVRMLRTLAAAGTGARSGAGDSARSGAGDSARSGAGDSARSGAAAGMAGSGERAADDPWAAATDDSGPTAGDPHR
jgi:hypothetical protein